MVMVSEDRKAICDNPKKAILRVIGRLNIENVEDYQGKIR